MKLKDYYIETQNRLRKALSENGKKNGYKKGNKHSKWNGGIKKNYDGYIVVRVYPDSLYYEMNIDGYVKRSRLVMAKHLGRCLKSSEIMHHCNGIIDDDRLDNLLLLKDHSEHATLHHRLRRLSSLKAFASLE